MDPPGGYFKKILSKNEKCSISCIIRISYIVYIKVNRTAVKNYILNKCEQDEYKKITWEAFRLYHYYYFCNENKLQNLKDLLKGNQNDKIVHYYIGKINEDYKNHKVAADHYKLAADLEEDDKIKIGRLLSVASSRESDTVSTAMFNATKFRSSLMMALVLDFVFNRQATVDQITFEGHLNLHRAAVELPILVGLI